MKNTENSFDFRWTLIGDELFHFQKIYEDESFDKDSTTYKHLNKNILHTCCQFGAINIFEYLINEHNFDINCKTVDGFSILHYCTIRSQYKLLEHILKKYPIDVNMVDNSNSTALMTGIQLDVSNKCNELLIEHGIDINICDNFHKFNSMFLCGLYDNIYIGKLIVETNRLNYGHKNAYQETVEEFLEKHLKDEVSLLLYVMMHKN